MSWRTHPLVRFLASLKLAVVVMGVSMAVMAVGTVVESHWNADLARLCLYQAPWFHAVLVLLFLNVLTSLLVRTPLKPHLYGFATTHVGILTILFGAALTGIWGIDGSLEFSEGESTSALRLPVPVVRHYVDGQMTGEAKVSKGIVRRAFGFPSLPDQPDTCRILEYMPFAQVRQRIVAAPAGRPVMELALSTGRGSPTVVQLALDNSILPDTQDLGLVDIRLERTDSVKSFLDTSRRTVERPTIRFGASGDSLLCRIEAHGKVRQAFPVVRGQVVQTPFGVVALSVGVWEPRGEVRDSAVPADIRPGQPLPPSAIRVGAGPWGAARWIPHGGFFGWTQGGKGHMLSFEDRRVSLPFGLRLDRFAVGHDPGTMQAASYASDVTVLDGSGKATDTAHIAMNRPLHRNGFTLYQASFVQEDGTASRSVLSVNRDPGRPFKYLGCLVLIAGIIWHTLIRAKRKNKGDEDHA